MFSISTPAPSARCTELAAASAKACGYSFPQYAPNLAKLLSTVRPGVFTICCAWTQSAKTGIQVSFIHALPRLLNKKVGFIWLTNKSLTTLFDQNKAALSEASFSMVAGPVDMMKSGDAYVCPLMVAGGLVDLDGTKKHHVIVRRNKLVHAQHALLAQGCEVIVLLMDETHIAVGANSQLARLTDLLGIDSLQEAMMVVGFTATPEIFTEAQKLTTAPTEVLTMQPGDGYYGPMNLIKHLSIFGGYTSSELERTMPFEPGKIVFMRMPRSKSEQQFLSGWLEAKGYAVTCFSTSPKDRPIAHLKGWLLSPNPDVCSVYLVKEAVSAGDDLKNHLAHVCAWFEDRHTSPTPVAQSLGRNTGYRVPHFPIYVTDATYQAYETYVQDMNLLMNHGVLPTPKSRRQAQARYRHDIGIEFIAGTYEEYEVQFDHSTGRKPHTTTAQAQAGTFFAQLEGGRLRTGVFDFISFQHRPSPKGGQAFFDELYRTYELMPKRKNDPKRGLWLNPSCIKKVNSGASPLLGMKKI